MTNPPDTTSAIDGRALRTQKSRRTIIEATLELYADGILVPTAQLVADRSGLGMRTVFRHFSEMEKLFVEGDKLLHEKFTALPKIEPTGNIEERVEQLIELRSDNCELFAPYIRATQAQLWRYSQLRSSYRKMLTVQRQRIFEFIPELAEASKSLQDAVDLALSFESWNRLSFTQKKSREDTQAIMRLSLHSLLKI